ERGITSTWTPPDLRNVIPEDAQDPQIVTTSVLVWAYNTDVFGDECPIDNICAVTTDKWKGQVTMGDPLLKTAILYWINQVAHHDDDAMAAAYEDYFGEQLATEEESATAEWLKRMAENEPLLVKSDSDAADTVGAPGQSDGFMGLMSTAKFWEYDDGGYKGGLCGEIKHFFAIGDDEVIV